MLWFYYTLVHKYVVGIHVIMIMYNNNDSDPGNRYSQVRDSG